MCLWLALTLGLFSVLPVKLTPPTALLPSAGKKCVHHNDPTYADFSSCSLAEGGLPLLTDACSGRAESVFPS